MKQEVPRKKSGKELSQQVENKNRGEGKKIGGKRGRRRVQDEDGHEAKRTKRESKQIFKSKYFWP